MYTSEYTTRLYNICIRSTNTFRLLTEVLEKLKNGSDIITGNYSEHVNKLVAKLNMTLTQTNKKMNLSREEILTIMLKHSRIFSQLIVEYFVAVCQTLKTKRTTPDSAQMRQFMDNVTFLHNNGFLKDVWGYFEGFVKVAVTAVRENGNNLDIDDKKSRIFRFSCLMYLYIIVNVPIIDGNAEYVMELYELLGTVGSTERTGVMVVVQLETVIDTFLAYVLDNNIQPSEEEMETLAMVLVVINEILEYNSRVRIIGGMQVFKKLNSTMRRLKIIISHCFVSTEIELCLGLLPF